MSNSLAIATVTEALKNLLTSYLDFSEVTASNVSTLSPDATTIPIPGINVFLYQISPNAALRNQDLPTRTQSGKLLRKPQAAIDLHYLLTFYGDYSSLEPQRLLGAATLALHSNPVLSPAQIQAAQTTFLADSTLSTQTEQIRFTPIAFTLEELSKLWSFLLKVDYVLSTAYVASVVLIEDDSQEPIPPPLPVLTYLLGARPLQQPVITQVVSAASPPGGPITAGSQIALIGSNLVPPSDATTQVLIGGIVAPAGVVSASKITVTLPGGLAAGPQTAQVMQPVSLGEPAVPHPGTGGASAVTPFMLSPLIAPAGSGFAIGPGPPQTSPPAPTIVATVIPIVKVGQRVLLQLIPQTSPPSPGRLFDGGVLTTASDTLTFPIPGLASGQYFARVLVDGAESPLAYGYGGAPIGPVVTV
jgi:Pvc16 N-terminal domain/IPT/TIG domain